MRSSYLAGLALVTVVVSLPVVANADVCAPAPTTVANFDAAQGQLPESFTTDGHGNFYLSMNHRVMKLASDGTLSQLADLPAASDLVFALGVKFGPDGNLYVGLGSFSAADHAASIWRVSPTTGAATELVHLDDAGFPNDLVFDDSGNMFVTDPFLARVWRVAPNGQASVWLQDASLAGNPPGGYLFLHDFGADGLAFDRNEHRLYISNLDRGQIVRVKVLHTGAPDVPEVWLTDPRLQGVDGITFDAHGNLFVAVNGQDQVLRIAPSKRISVVAAGGALDGPSAVVLSPDQETLYVSSFAISSYFGTPRSRHPGTALPNLLSVRLR